MSIPSDAERRDGDDGVLGDEGYGLLRQQLLAGNDGAAAVFGFTMARSFWSNQGRPKMSERFYWARQDDGACDRGLG